MVLGKGFLSKSCSDALIFAHWFLSLEQKGDVPIMFTQALEKYGDCNPEWSNDNEVQVLRGVEAARVSGSQDNPVICID